MLIGPSVLYGTETIVVTRLLHRQRLMIPTHVRHLVTHFIAHRLWLEACGREENFILHRDLEFWTEAERSVAHLEPELDSPKQRWHGDEYLVEYEELNEGYLLSFALPPVPHDAIRVVAYLRSRDNPEHDSDENQNWRQAINQIHRNLAGMTKEIIGSQCANADVDIRESSEGQTIIVRAQLTDPAKRESDRAGKDKCGSGIQTASIFSNFQSSQVVSGTVDYNQAGGLVMTKIATLLVDGKQVATVTAEPEFGYALVIEPAAKGNVVLETLFQHIESCLSEGKPCIGGDGAIRFRNRCSSNLSDEVQIAFTGSVNVRYNQDGAEDRRLHELKTRTRGHSIGRDELKAQVAARLKERSR